MIVLDASAIVEVLLNSDLGNRIDRRWTDMGEAQAPHLAGVEVLSVLRRLSAIGKISTERGKRAVSRLATLPVERRAHEPLLGRVWELRHNLSAYDATYVALAEALGAPLITCDARLAAAPGNRAWIELFEIT